MSKTHNIAFIQHLDMAYITMAFSLFLARGRQS